jgi:hypothetical protein
MQEPSEHSRSGNPIYRYQKPAKDFEFAAGDEQNIEAISAHIEKFAGEPETVFHELVSDKVHIDVHFVPPQAGRDFHTLVTSGMSDRPMIVPAGCEDRRFAELLLCLPAGWKLTQEDFKDERNYWPVRLLRFLARFPHEYETWLGLGHTIPNGDPPEQFCDTKFCCALIAPPRLFAPEFATLQVAPDKPVHFLAVLPIFREEMELKLNKGADALWEKFDRHGVTELIDVRRGNTAKKFLGLF